MNIHEILHLNRLGQYMNMKTAAASVSCDMRNHFLTVLVKVTAQVKQTGMISKF